jgi:hypothetical protein
MAEWADKRVLITIRTYPVPARKGVEVSCTGGITDGEKWIRLYPVPYRFLEEDKRFSKYQWINVSVTKPRNDNRPESFSPRLDTLKIGDTIPSDDNWRGRREIIRPLMRRSLCAIRREHEENGSPTLGVFKPAQITGFTIEDSEQPTWTNEQLAILRQIPMFDAAPSDELEKIPFDFKYQFRCSEDNCRGHNLTCFDWEIGQAYRGWRRKYGDKWEKPFRNKFENEMINEKDTHFFVGNMHQRPNNWIIVGLFYPPLPKMRDLFDVG